MKGSRWSEGEYTWWKQWCVCLWFQYWHEFSVRYWVSINIKCTMMALIIQQFMMNRYGGQQRSYILQIGKRCPHQLSDNRQGRKGRIREKMEFRLKWRVGIMNAN